jgi:serine/threonine-protein kinase
MKITPCTWTAVSKLFDEALECDAANRADWLQRIAATHADLVPLLNRLLAAHSTSETADVLAHLPQIAPAALEAIDAFDLTDGSRVGPYRLTREIGSGGMAEVWLAERADGAFEREVALKLPRLSSLQRGLEVRFAQERDILARLEHPHIARFYDAGVSPDGLPYLAMEYVAGLPLNRWCDEQRLNTRARLVLFAQVLDAVQFAHANLIIHRDLKPSNILVTAGAQVRLLDFGIAKLLSDGESTRETRVTRFAGRALTPDYASPEQIQGESLTIASDVYSLGVVLYELLTGELPYRLKLQSVAQLEEAIIHVEPLRPSRAVTTEGALARGASARRLGRLLRGDLDTIVLKALAKAPAERYATIAEFAEDLARYLTGQTVQARPASWVYRTRKFIGRNRAGVAAAALLSVALASAAAVSLWQAQRARAQAARAEAVKNFVLSFFESADTDNGGSRQTSAVDLLKQARKRLDAAQITDDSIRVELLTTVASGLLGLGELQSAEPVLAEAARLAHKSLGDRHPLTAKASAWYGWALLAAGKTELATAQLDAAEHISRSIGDLEDLTRALYARSIMRATEGQYDSAIELIGQAIRTGERAPGMPKYELINMYADAANLTRGACRKGALEPAQRALALARQVYGKRTGTTLLYAQETYAAALGEEGDIVQALNEMRAVLQQQALLLGRDNMQVATTFGRLGGLQVRFGDPLAAVESLKEKLRIAQAQSAGKPTGAIAIARSDLGDMLTNAHHYDEAVSEWRQADAAYTALYGAESDEARAARSGAAVALTRIGRLAEADTAASGVLEQPFHSRANQAFVKVRVGLVRSAQGRHAEARALLSDADSFFANSPNWLRALSLAGTGHVLLADGRLAESLERLQQAQTLLRQSQRNGSPDLADICIDMARVHLALGHAEQAQAAAEEAAQFWARFDSSHGDGGVALLWLARALAAGGHGSQAADAVRRARAILGANGLLANQALLEQTERELRAAATAQS